MMTPHERYLHDPEFHALVETIYGWIDRCAFTPTEVREAAMVAAIRHSESRGHEPFPHLTSKCNVQAQVELLLAIQAAGHAGLVGAELAFKCGIATGQGLGGRVHALRRALFTRFVNPDTVFRAVRSAGPTVWRAGPDIAKALAWLRGEELPRPS